MDVVKYWVRGKKFWRIVAQPIILTNMREGAGLKTAGFRTREAARIEVRLYEKWMQQEEPGVTGESVPGPAGDQVAADAASSA